MSIGYDAPRKYGCAAKATRAWSERLISDLKMAHTSQAVPLVRFALGFRANAMPRYRAPVRGLLYTHVRALNCSSSTGTGGVRRLQNVSGHINSIGTRQQGRCADSMLHPILIIDRDRGEPCGSAPLTPPGIRVTYHGGSIGLCVGMNGHSWQADRIEIGISQCLLYRRMSRHTPEPRW
jgi:hypothetical protein